MLEDFGAVGTYQIYTICVGTYPLAVKPINANAIDLCALKQHFISLQAFVSSNNVAGNPEIGIECFLRIKGDYTTCSANPNSAVIIGLYIYPCISGKLLVILVDKRGEHLVLVETQVSVVVPDDKRRVEIACREHLGVASANVEAHALGTSARPSVASSSKIVGDKV